MKIAIPVENNDIEKNVCISFGRTPYFLIHDTESKEDVFLDNAAVTSQSGAGIKAAQLIVDSKVNALLTPRCGENAAEVLKASGIKIYKTINDSVTNNINAFMDEKLDLLDEIHAGFHNHGGK